MARALATAGLADWQKARRELRQAGHEVVQYNGILKVDGKISCDRRLYPPGTPVPAAAMPHHRDEA